MFGRLLDEMKEPFTGSSQSSEAKAISKTQNYFSQVLPNIIYNNNPKIDIARLTEVSNTRIATNQDTLRQKWLQTDNNKELLKQKEADCKNSRGLDPFDHLTRLNSTEDQSSRLRCGWIYNKTNPNLGGGALGLEEGPISSKAPGVWNWDLKLAKEQMHIDICKDIQGCKDIDRLSLKQRCGWCDRLQKAVPITKNGKVAYPWNKVGGCPASNVITNGAKCPAIPPSDEDEETASEPCDPLADGRMSRLCMVTKYKDAGCSDKGSLGRALATGSDHDYMNSIYSQKAYQVYQQRASLSLNEYGLKTGSMSMNDALNEFDRLALAASKSPSGGNAIDYATRDLCLNQGEMSGFDFCTEITDSTVGPYSIDCLQKAFLKSGGQKNGLMYPSPKTMSKWNSIPNWRGVLSEMQNIKKDAGSANSNIKYIGTKNLIDATITDPFKCSTALLPRNITLSRGNVVARFTATQDYKLEFDITPISVVGGWGSIFHFSADGNNCCSQGQRSPAIWFVPGGLGLHARIGDSTNGNWGYDNVPGCQIGKKSHIILECKGTDVRLTIDSTVHRMTQPTFRYSGPITVFASDPWHDIPKATLENVCLQLHGNSTILPSGPIKINIGNSNSNEKIIRIPTDIPPTFRNIKVVSQGHSDDFVCRIDGNNLVVRRVDNFSGWGANYTAEIIEGVQPHIPNIAFVRIEGGSEPLNLSQIVVLDEKGNNISRGRPQQVNSETYGDANKTKANDGGEAPRGHPNEYHGRGGDDLWQVQLNGTQKVSAVIIYNRSDCCQGRMASGYVIKLYTPNLSGGYKVVFTSKRLNANLVQVVKTS